MTSTRARKTTKNSTRRRKGSRLNVDDRSYKGKSAANKVTRMGDPSATQSLVIAPFCGQRLPPADSMLFATGSVESSSTQPSIWVNCLDDEPSVIPIHIVGPSRQDNLEVPHPRQRRLSNTTTASYQRPDECSSEEQEYYAQPRWQTAPTPDYLPRELTQPIFETPTIKAEYDDDFSDFLMKGPPATPRYIESDLPVFSNTTNSCQSSSQDSSIIRHQQPWNTSRGVVPSMQLLSPDPSPCRRSKALPRANKHS